MKLPRRRRTSAPEPAEPVSAAPAAPVLQLVIFSNTSLPEQEFSAQKAKIRRVASYDNETRSWYSHVHLDRPQQAAEMLSTLFEVARLHGTTIQVRAQPAGDSAPPGQPAGAP